LVKEGGEKATRFAVAPTTSAHTAVAEPDYTEPAEHGSWTTAMAKLTITIDDEVLKRACLRATEQGTSVNAVARAYLEQYAGSRTAQREAVARLLALSKQATSRLGQHARSRDQLHER